MYKSNLRDSYKEYSLQDEVVDIKTYLLITASYNKFLSKKVLEGHEVTLPSKMGTLCIVGKKQDIKFNEKGEVIGLAPDWVKTKALWERNEEAKKNKKRLFHLNSHTDNFRYKFLWSKVKVLVENKTLYALRMTRENKRAVHKSILNGQKYITK
jgi:hypothetical protein